MPDEQLPESAGGKCPTCLEWLYFEAATATRPACFRCGKCGKLYRGAAEWKTTPGMGK